MTKDYCSIPEALELFAKLFKNEYGANATIKAGEDYVVEFSNCSLVVTCEKNNQLTAKFVKGKVFKINADVSLF